MTVVTAASVPDQPWTPAERAMLDRLATPEQVQAFLDEVPYSTDHTYRCPRSVLRDRRAHCFDGALLAACALRRQGEPPLLVDLRAERDDDHVLAVFRRGGHWGAVAKSNFSGLRFREPIHRSLRELALSYFDDYYNTDGEKSLRSYSVVLDLGQLDHLGWTTRDDSMQAIAGRLDRIRHHPLITPEMAARLAPVDRRSYAAGMLGVDEAGLYRPRPAGK